MKNILSVFSALLLTQCVIFAQAPDTLWTKTYGGSNGDYGASVKQTSDSGYILVGTSTIPNYEIWLIKTDKFGDTLWTKYYGGNSTEFGNDVALTNDGGYIITGSTSSFSQFSQVWIVKTNGTGDTIWTSIPGPGTGNSVIQALDGGYIIVGTTESSFYDKEIWLIKTDNLGDTIWTKTFGFGLDDNGESVSRTTDGGCIIIGLVFSSPINLQTWLIKTDSLGNTLWVQTYENVVGHSIQQTTDGGYIFTGDLYYGNDRNNEVILIRTNETGDLIWRRNFMGGRGIDVKQTNDGGFVIVGTTADPYPEDHDIFITKTTSSGDSSWTIVLSGEENDWGKSIEQTLDGGYILTGFTSSYGMGSSDFWLVKLGPDPPAFIENFETLIEHHRLLQNFPNPFNSATVIQYSIPNRSNVTLKIYDILGNEVATLVNEEKDQGVYTINFNANNLASGLYLYRIQAGSFIETKKMILLK